MDETELCRYCGEPDEDGEYSGEVGEYVCPCCQFDADEVNP